MMANNKNSQQIVINDPIKDGKWETMNEASSDIELDYAGPARQTCRVGAQTSSQSDPLPWGIRPKQQVARQTRTR